MPKTRTKSPTKRTNITATNARKAQEAVSRVRRGKSPTQRTLEHCRKVGNFAAVVERWNPHAHKRQDLFGFCDIVELDKLRGVCVAIQATSGSNHSERRKKITSNEKALEWLRCGGLIEVWSWSLKAKKRGGRRVWVPRVENITVEMFDEDSHG